MRRAFEDAAKRPSFTRNSAFRSAESARSATSEPRSPDQSPPFLCSAGSIDIAPRHKDGGRRKEPAQHPCAAWAAQQIVEAIGAEIVPARLVRDRDAIFGTKFDARLDNLGIRQIRISSRSPWQNGYAERWVGTLRRELLDHLIVLGERHLLRLVR